MGMVYGYQNKWDHHNDYIWIIVGPMATVLIVSFLFLRYQQPIRNLRIAIFFLEFYFVYCSCKYFKLALFLKLVGVFCLF